MSELTIQRNRDFTPPTFQAAAKTGKQSESSAVQKPAAEKPGTVNISDTLKDLMARIGQAEGQLRESRGVLQLGQAVLDEVKDSLDKIAELVKESAEGEEPDREALQAELEKLTAKIDRMLSGVSAGDRPLFLEGGAELIEGILSGEIDLDEVLDAVRQLLEKLAEGMSPEQLLETLNAGSPLLAMLAGMEGMNLELLMGLLTTLQGGQAAAQGAAQGAEQQGGAAQTAGATGAEQAAAQSAPQTLQFGAVQVTGQDLSGVSFDEATGEVTISGAADVTVRGTGQGEQPAIRLAGSGQVTLQDVKASVLTVDAPEARAVSEGENRLGEIRMGQGTSLTLEGGGLVRLDALHGDASNLVRLTGGALVVTEEAGRPSRELTVPVVVEGAALLAVQAASVRDAGGKALEPFDLMLKALMPNLASLTSLEVDGKQVKHFLQNGELARLWLDKGDPSHGFTIHTLFLQGKDEAGQLRKRYAYLRWNQQEEQFQEIDMYPNPFTVTGGEAGEDWVYEEESQTLCILTSQVTAISGGMGVDAMQEPFSGRVVLADHIALIELTLEGVECRVKEGKAFDLGRDNEVFLTLASGSRNVFESGDGCWGISMGEDSHVNIGYAAGPIGILAATIGTDTTPEPKPEPEPEEGIPLRMGGGTVTLPQFRLSSKILRLDMLRVSSREYAQAAMTIVDADRRWVSQIQSVYRALYSQLDRSAGGCSGGRQAAAPEAAAVVRDVISAGTLMEDVKRTIHLQPELASYLHSRRGQAELHRLLK